MARSVQTMVATIFMVGFVIAALVEGWRDNYAQAAFHMSSAIFIEVALLAEVHRR